MGTELVNILSGDSAEIKVVKGLGDLQWEVAGAEQEIHCGTLPLFQEIVKYHHDAELLRSCGLCFRKGGDGQAGGIVVSRCFYYGFTTFQCQMRLRNAMICGVSSETQNAGNA